MAEGNFAVPIPIDSRDEVGQLAMTFDEMQTRLARLDSARKEFIANASHELRTPIFSLGGFVELLETEEPDPEARREFVSNMREQVDRLGKLATDLLELSKLDAGALELRETPVDLGRLATQVADEFGPAADQHSLADRGRPPTAGAIARGDPDRIGQILRILIDNALRHTPEGTPIDLTVASRTWNAPRSSCSDRRARHRPRGLLARCSSASTRATRSAAPASGWRSPGSWRCG